MRNYGDMINIRKVTYRKGANQNSKIVKEIVKEIVKDEWINEGIISKCFRCYCQKSEEEIARNERNKAGNEIIRINIYAISNYCAKQHHSFFISRMRRGHTRLIRKHYLIT